MYVTKVYRDVEKNPSQCYTVSSNITCDSQGSIVGTCGQKSPTLGTWHGPCMQVAEKHLR